MPCQWFSFGLAHSRVSARPARCPNNEWAQPEVYRPTAAAAHASPLLMTAMPNCGIAHSAVPEWWIPNPFLRRGSSRFTCRRPSFLACAVQAQMCGRGEPGPSAAVGGAWPPPRRAPTAKCATARPAALTRRPRPEGRSIAYRGIGVVCATTHGRRRRPAAAPGPPPRASPSRC
jgi:hypothetical protein